MYLCICLIWEMVHKILNLNAKTSLCLNFFSHTSGKWVSVKTENVILTFNFYNGPSLSKTCNIFSSTYINTSVLYLGTSDPKSFSNYLQHQKIKSLKKINSDPKSFSNYLKHQKIKSLKKINSDPKSFSNNLQLQKIKSLKS